MANNTITTLKLSANDIGDEGVIALSQALARNAAITNLNLAFNNIGDEGVEALARILARNTTITNLNLSFNNIGDKGVEALSQALAINTTITTLNLSSNNIKDRGGKLLADALAQNNKIRELDLRFNKINSENHIVEKHLKKNNNLAALAIILTTSLDSPLNWEESHKLIINILERFGKIILSQEPDSRKDEFINPEFCLLLEEARAGLIALASDQPETTPALDHPLKPEASDFIALLRNCLDNPDGRGALANLQFAMEQLICSKPGPIADQNAMQTADDVTIVAPPSAVTAFANAEAVHESPSSTVIPDSGTGLIDDPESAEQSCP
jgi:hypothetical protein